VDALRPCFARPEPTRSRPGGPLPAGLRPGEYLAQIERELIDRALTNREGVKKDAAARLGLTFRSSGTG